MSHIISLLNCNYGLRVVAIYVNIKLLSSSCVVERTRSYTRNKKTSDCELFLIIKKNNKMTCKLVIFAVIFVSCMIVFVVGVSIIRQNK